MARFNKTCILLKICMCIALEPFEIIAEECSKPMCFIYAERNSSLTVNVNHNGRDTMVTTFCFKGVPESLRHLWINPVLQIKRNARSLNESSRFISFYGTSVSDVRKRSAANRHRIFQEMAAKLRPLRETDDLPMDPFNLSCLLIDTNVEYSVSVKIKAVDLWYVVYLVAGTVLFFSAKSWSHLVIIAKIKIKLWTGNMFNYQAKVYDRLTEAWFARNLTEDMSSYIDTAAKNAYRAVKVVYKAIPESVRETELLSGLYKEWKMYYHETYKWIHPMLTEISNTSLHYGTGVSVGVLASILILVFILTKLLPSRLKNLGYALMLFGSSVSLWLLTSVGNIFSDSVTDTLIEYWQYVLGYILTAGVLSFAIVYRYGPVTDERSLTLIQWFLQCVGLVLVYNSTQIQEVSIALVLVLLAIYNFPTSFLVNTKSKNIWYRFFPPKVKLLTEEEYIIQGNRETKKELEKLREYCRSPDCQAWKIISKLKSPQRFAEFVEGNSWHVTNEELLEYDSGPDPTPSHLISDDDSDEEEMDFMLSSP